MELNHEFLKKYVNNYAPTSIEYPGQQLWLDYLKPYLDTWFTDQYGTAVGVINPEAEYKVVIEAHADEIAWYVSYITSEGYLYVQRNGGSDAQIAPSKTVYIHGDDGMVQGVFGWPAVHVRNNENENAPTLKNIFIDIGCNTKDEVLEKGVHVGSIVTFDDQFKVMNDRYYCGRALDNRVGGFIIAEVARKLKEDGKSLPFGLYIVNSVQEEVGLRGAQMIAHRIKPDVAVITDVCHDTQSPMYNKVTAGDIKAGSGPVFTYASAVHHNLLNMLIKVAEKHEIPFQRNTKSRGSGTDTDSFAYSNEGVPSALIALPLKYMHTTVEMVHKEDVENLVKVFYEFLLQLEKGHDFRYIK